MQIHPSYHTVQQSIIATRLKEVRANDNLVSVKYKGAAYIPVDVKLNL